MFCCAINKTKVNLRRLYDKTGVINIMNDKRIWRQRPKQNNEHMCASWKSQRCDNPNDIRFSTNLSMNNPNTTVY